MILELTDEEKLEIEKGKVRRLLEHYHVIYSQISTPEYIIDKVDLDMAINSLEGEENLIIRKAYIEGYTVRETAKMTGKSRSTVSRIGNNALEKIAEKCILI